MVINQIHAIGDLIFLEPMYRHFWNRDGVKPVVPVRDHLMWLANYIDSADFRPMSKFNWGKYGEDYMQVEKDYLPTRWANQIIRGYSPHDHHDFENCMLDKYRMAGIKETSWTDIVLKFNVEKSKELLKYLNPQGPFALINTHSQAGEIKTPDTISPNLQKIYMHEVPGFTVIDWYLAMRDAEEFHTVSTCTFFILQALFKLYHNKTFLPLPKITIYPRPNEDGLRGISQLKPTFRYDRGN